MPGSTNLVDPAFVDPGIACPGIGHTLAANSPTGASGEGRQIVTLAHGSTGEPAPGLSFTPDFDRLAPLLARFQLTPADVNLAKTVTFALPPHEDLSPGTHGILLMSVPLRVPTVPLPQALFAQGRQTVVGVLRTCRPVPLAAGDDTVLKPDVYLVTVSGMGGDRARIVYLAPGNIETAGATITRDADLRIGRDTPTPQSVLTHALICQAWGNMQLCFGPRPRDLLTAVEGEAMRARMAEAEADLRTAGLIEAGESALNVDATVPDLEGRAAVAARRASMIATTVISRTFVGHSPTPPPHPVARMAAVLARWWPDWLTWASTAHAQTATATPTPAPTPTPTPLPAEPTEGELLGTVIVDSPIDSDGQTVAVGTYAIRATRDGTADKWFGQFNSTATTIVIPAKLTGEIIKPLPNKKSTTSEAIILNIRIGLCFFEC
ncbi:hypothetical protein DCC79_03855 [bacterium]|nr:hypothetical protein [Chloroflexi bacterium CFX6]RIL11770.1 MAG: hypothetical protein DCC79_03855 [bacterium]